MYLKNVKVDKSQFGYGLALFFILVNASMFFGAGWVQPFSHDSMLDKSFRLLMANCAMLVLLAVLAGLMGLGKDEV